jgi:hypothetical protein
MSNPINISNDIHFEKLLKRLSDDILSAPAFLRMDKQLSEFFEKYRDEVVQAEFFWGMVAPAVRETALLRLSRVYDQRPDTLSLRTLLATIEANKHLFEDDMVRKRVNTAFANSITPGSHLPNAKTIQTDLALVSSSDPLVNKIVIWRGNFGAHVSAKLTIENTLGDEKVPTQEEAFSLADRALKVFNHYTSLFHAVSYSMKYLNEEGSLESVFKYMRAGLTARRRARDEAAECPLKEINRSQQSDLR